MLRFRRTAEQSIKQQKIISFIIKIQNVFKKVKANTYLIIIIFIIYIYIYFIVKQVTN